MGLLSFSLKVQRAELGPVEEGDVDPRTIDSEAIKKPVCIRRRAVCGTPKGESIVERYWLDFAGYSARPTKGMVGAFADDLLLISGDTGLIVEVDGEHAAGAIDVLRFTANRQTHWDKTAVKLKLPIDFRTRIEARLSVLTAQQAPVRRIAWPAARLKKEISRSRAKNKDLAEYLHISDSLVSQWVRGTRPVALAHDDKISQFFREKQVSD